LGFVPHPNRSWQLASWQVSIHWGTSWLWANATVLAEVPSVIVPEDYNILINPHHPDVAKITAVKIRRWTYDHRFK
jgi:RES domain-containing protein